MNLTKQEALDIAEKLEQLNEAVKEVGNGLWDRGPECQAFANEIYKSAKRLWIASTYLERFSRVAK